MGLRGLRSRWIQASTLLRLGCRASFLSLPLRASLGFRVFGIFGCKFRLLRRTSCVFGLVPFFRLLVTTPGFVLQDRKAEIS